MIILNSHMVWLLGCTLCYLNNQVKKYNEIRTSRNDLQIQVIFLPILQKMGDFCNMYCFSNKGCYTESNRRGSYG